MQLLHLHLAQGALLDLLLHAHARQKGHALVVLHQLADGLDGRHFHRHVQRHAPPLKLAHLGERVLHFQLQILEAARVVEHGAAGVGQHQVFGGAVDQLFAQFRLQPR